MLRLKVGNSTIDFEKRLTMTCGNFNSLLFPV
jgi:hypothetical protein